jgi:hypothetical protein
MSAFYPSLTLGVKLRNIKAYPWYKQYIHMASMNYFLIGFKHQRENKQNSDKYTLYTHCVCTTVYIMSSQLEKPYHYEA